MQARRVLILSFVCIALLAAGPTLYNVLFLVRYEMGTEYMKRHSGERGHLAGAWQMTFDTIPCGIDSRQRWTLLIGDDGTGRLRAEYYGAKRFFYPHGTSVGSLGSLLPYDKSRAHGEECEIRDTGTHLVASNCKSGHELESVTEDAYTFLDDLVLYYEVRGNRLYVAEVQGPEEIPDRFGLYESPSYRLKHTLAWWW